MLELLKYFPVGDRISMNLGIDLGTANTLIYVQGKGIMLREPSVVAVDLTNDTCRAVGDEARNMLGKNHTQIKVMKPLREGVIADNEYTSQMLFEFINRIRRMERTKEWWSIFYGFKIINKVVVGIPSGITKVERKAVEESLGKAGCRNPKLIDEPMAAAIGADLPISEPQGNMIVDIGGGTSEVAVISLNGIVCKKSIRIAGNELDRSIIEYTRKRFNLQIGERTAERIKITIGSASPTSEDLLTEMRGMDLVTGLPKVVEINTQQTREAMQEKIDLILKAVRDTLEETPPELAADIIEQGITLAGGGAMLRDIDIVIAKDTGIATRRASSPLDCVVLGTKKILENPDLFDNL